VKARGVRIELEHPKAGRLPMVASPMRFSATPPDYTRAPPVLGEHTAEVLGEVLEKSEAEIARLREARVI
jgi:crotonobetainyl-CoA:carnitine CoA-transferase CaiB-like acyl-CoA transferase